jgi:beta-galactosidase GanA
MEFKLWKDCDLGGFDETTERPASMNKSKRHAGCWRSGRGSAYQERFRTLRLTALACGAVIAAVSAGLAAAQSAPHLAQSHGATQIVVNGKPFLVRGGELENSSASSLKYLDTVWPKAAAMRFNTVIAPVYWQLIEPREGTFDFATVDGLIEGARKRNMKLVLLWFGSWKNSMSSYAPGWVKRDEKRFPRAALSDGSGIEILSALSPETLEADATAFATLMKHVKAMDAVEQTVIMVQVENEVGMIPEARDHGALANAAFLSTVPAALTDYLQKHRETLDPALKNAWETHGEKSGADWPDTFGSGTSTDELFTAWTEGRFTGEVAARGKAVYPLPMYVNAALVRPGRLPGQYPSGGPLPHLFDIWRAAAPAIDFLAPDLYFPNFVEWAGKYVRPGNPLFIPETGRVDANEMAANALYAYGQLNAMGFSVYAPEFLKVEDQQDLGDAYTLMEQITPLIVANQGTGRMAGIRAPAQFDGTVDLTPQDVTLGDYVFHVRFRQPALISVGARAESDLPGAHGGLIIQLSEDNFLVAGTGMIVTFGARGNQSIAGIASIWEGSFVNGTWIPGRNLNGDDDNQGRYLRLTGGKFEMRRVSLYQYH